MLPILKVVLREIDPGYHGYWTIAIGDSPTKRFGTCVERRYKSILATSHVVGGVVRVVLHEFSRGDWAAYVSTNTELKVELILRTVDNHWAMEEHFHDVKEIWGAGEQQF